MNMVLLNTDLYEDNFVPLSNLQAYIPKSQIYLFCKHNPSVFGRAYQMIKKYRYVMMLMDIFTHIIMLTPSKDRSKLRGINPKGIKRKQLS